MAGRYGIDAPLVPGLLGTLGLGLVAAGLVVLANGGPYSGWTVALVVWDLMARLVLVASASVYLHTTLRGKFEVWSELLDGLALRGDERVLDMGCGRGAVLVLVARRLDTGRAVGLDLWRGIDQSGNSSVATRANAQAEGVADRIDLRTGDMTAMQFGDGDFNLVMASMGLHNVPNAEHRAAAVDEAARVLRPGGRLAIVDFRHVRDTSRGCPIAA
jgi:arsenite methyltransferase